jgi:hypothetical protein
LAAQDEHEAPEPTVQPTALVHEAAETHWGSRARGKTVATSCVRLRRCAKSSIAPAPNSGLSAATTKSVHLEEVDVAVDAKPEALLLMDEALEALAGEYPENPNSSFEVLCRAECGETAKALGISPKT